MWRYSTEAQALFRLRPSHRTRTPSPWASERYRRASTNALDSFVLKQPFWLTRQVVKRLPKLSLPAKPIVIDTITAQKRAVAEILSAAKAEGSEPVLGFDAETRVLFPKKKGEKVPQLPVAAIQLSTLSKAYVFRLRVEDRNGGMRKVGITPELCKLLSGEGGATLVAHGLENDLKVLSRHYPEVSSSSSRGVCLEKAAQAIPSFPQSLNGNCAVFLGHSLDKRKHLSLGNWEKRVLSRDMINYAALDAFASLAVFREMRRMAAGGGPPPAGVAAAAAAAAAAGDGGDGAAATQWELGNAARLRLCQALNGLPFPRVKQPLQIIAEKEAEDAGEREEEQDVGGLASFPFPAGDKLTNKNQEEKEEGSVLQAGSSTEREGAQGDRKMETKGATEQSQEAGGGAIEGPSEEEQKQEKRPTFSFEERLEICKLCEHSQSETVFGKEVVTWCRVCGCHIPGKAFFESSSCDKGKW